MKKTFYHPHTILDSISDLDERWLTKQLDEKPFDIHFQYLNMLKNIDKDFESGVYRSIQRLRQLDPNIRIGHILQRITKEQDLALNSVSSVTIKSKKSDEAAATSIVLTGLIYTPDTGETYDVSSHQEEESISEVNLDEGNGPVSDIDATSSTDTEEAGNESILQLDTIDIGDKEDIVEEANTVEDNSIAESAAIIGAGTLAIDAIDFEEDEEEEIVEQDEVVVKAVEDTVEEVVVVSHDAGYETLETEVIEAKTESIEEELEAPADQEAIAQHQASTSNFTDWLNSLPNFHSTGNTQTAEPTVISEPLAQLLVKQGHKADAISMYKQLMQKFPEKSSFFADQIENLK